MASPRKNPTARAGNYVAPVDSSGMDASMKASLFGTKMDKTESAYIKGTGGRPSAMEAVRRARKANKRPPVQE